MKKIFTLVILITMASMVLFAQTAKEPQQEFDKLQQKVKSLQGADQKIRAQVNELQNSQTQATMEVGVSMKQLDSLMKANRDSMLVATNTARENATAISRIDSSMLVYRILAIVAVLLSLLVLFMLFRLRTGLTNLKEEEDLKIKEGDEKLEKKVGEILAKLQKISDELGVKIQSAETRMNEIRSTLSQELSGGLDGLKQDLLQAKTELRGELEAQAKKHEAGAAESGHGFTELGTRLDSNLHSVKGELQKLEDKWKTELSSAAERLGKEAGELKKSLQSFLKHPKDPGN
jgi:vacuolar-type H+-ATPase subunit I/STV1